MSDQSHDRRDGDGMSVAEAARLLGISAGAVRKRVERGKLEAGHAPDGRLIVYPDRATTTTDTTHDRPRPSRDGRGQYATFDRDELIAELRARIEDLRTDRDAWRDQARRSDYLASTAIDRTRELEGRLRELEAPAPSEPTGGPPPTAEEPTGAEDPGPGPTQQTTTRRRPWWHRIVGG